MYKKLDLNVTFLKFLNAATIVSVAIALENHAFAR